MVFNILVGNTDDHARNHAAFWDGKNLALTPAYDICPQGRSGNVATQSMAISGNDNRSQIAACLDASEHFLLTRKDAVTIALHLAQWIASRWEDVCDIAHVSQVDKRMLASRQFFNPYAFERLDPTEAGDLTDIFREFAARI